MMDNPQEQALSSDLGKVLQRHEEKSSLKLHEGSLIEKLATTFFEHDNRLLAELSLSKEHNDNLKEENRLL